MLDSLVMIANETSGQYAGLILRQPQSICRVRCFSTQNKGLTVCLLREHDEPVPKAAFKEHFDVQSAAVQTQLSYLHLSSSLQTRERFRDEQVPKAAFKEHFDVRSAAVQTQLSFPHLSSSLQTRERFILMRAALCEVGRKMLYNKLQAVAGDRNPYVLLDLYGSGHEVANAGAAAPLKARERFILMQAEPLKDSRPFKAVHQVPSGGCETSREARTRASLVMPLMTEDSGIPNDAIVDNHR